MRNLIAYYLTGECRMEPFEGGKCPKCEGDMPQGYPGTISKYDNQTEICSKCGTEESMEQFFSKYKN